MNIMFAIATSIKGTDQMFKVKKDYRLNRIKEKRVTNHNQYGLFAVVIMAFALFSSASMASEPVLERLSSKEDSNGTIITVHFLVPFTYQSHTPTTANELVEVNLISVGVEGSSQAGFQEQVFEKESLAWKPSVKAPLQEVEFDPFLSQNPGIILHFSRAVPFEIKPHADAFGVDIFLPHKAKKVRSINKNDKNWSVNIQSSVDKLAINSMPEDIKNKDTYLYTTKFTSRDNKIWTRYRVGPFMSESDAKTWTEKARKYYPGAWLTQIDKEEYRLALNGSKLLNMKNWLGKSSASDIPKTSKDMLNAARWALSTDDLDTAIRLYGKILRMPRNDQQALAQEFLGVARMRKGQLAQARLAWKQYLLNYPEGEGALRVEQRLQGLYTAQLNPLQQKDKPGMMAKNNQKPSNWKVVSGLSQYIREDSVYLEAEDESTTQVHYLLTDINTRATHKGENWITQMQFSGGYSYDFLDDGPGNRSRVSTAYIDLKQADGPMFTRLGRQSRTFSGLFGRFDGALFGYDINDKLTAKVVAGYPVQSSSDVTLDTDRNFYGVALDLNELLKNWKLSAYMIQQNNQSYEDRQAVGLESRYTSKNGTLYGKVDYDYLFKELNSLTLVANWRIFNKTQLRFSVDHRASPFFTLNNAILGQQVDDIQQFIDLTGYTQEQLQVLAADRTAKLTYANMGITYPISSKLQAGFDISLSNLTGTPTLEAIPGSPNTFGLEMVEDTGNEFTYAFQLFGSSWLVENDSSTISFRHFDGQLQSRETMDLSWRFPLTRKLRINPRIKFDSRNIFKTDITQTTWRASIKTNYRWTRKTRFEFETGYEQVDDDQFDSLTKRSSFFYNIGYRTEF